MVFNEEKVASATGARVKNLLRKLMLILWVALWPLLLALHLYPIRIGAVRLGLLLGCVGLWTGALWLGWNVKAARYACLAVAIIVGGFFCLPGRAANSASLRQDDVRSLLDYEGATYVWGGESKRGIDCSGLVRCGLIDANFTQGLRTINPRLMREGLSLWWHDCSAREMKDGYRQRTRLLFIAPDLNTLNYAALQPSDFAVTSSGVHTLAYIGNRTWIEADPNAGRVIKVQVPAKSAWFHMPVHLMRWRQLEGAS